MKKKGCCRKGRVAPKPRRVRDGERCPTSARLSNDLCLRQRLQRGPSPSPPCPASSPPGALGPLDLTWHPWVSKAPALNPPPLVGFWGRTGSADDREGARMCSSPPSPPAGFCGRSEICISSQRSSCKIWRKRMLGGCLYPLRAAAGSCPTAARYHRFGGLHCHLAHVRCCGARYGFS